MGSSSDNDIVLTDPSVSCYHLELSAGEGIALQDLGSRSGTFVKDIRILSAVVPVGSSVRVGDTVVRVVDGVRAVSTSEPLALEIPGLVARSSAMQRICRTIYWLGRSNVSVLLEGETGTGKNVVARAIHESSARASGPFIRVDCGALPPALIASQLFGHEGDADERREGAFERANRGSIFLDRIGELPFAFQPALLGVLERGVLRRLGGKRNIRTDVRVIAATDRDLRTEANRGTFRPDLYGRLAAVRIRIPPLRDRPDDIEPLVKALSRELTGWPDVPFSYAAMEALRGYHWSGNVTELREVVESALTVRNLSLDCPQGASDGDAIIAYQRARSGVITAFEREYLKRIIQQTGGNVAAASSAANVGRTQLVALLKKHRLSLTHE